MKRCSQCNSNNVVKNGFNRGRQRYLCRSCNNNFINGHKSKFPSELKVFVSLLWKEGKEYQSIYEELISMGYLISKKSIYRWKSYGSDRNSDINSQAAKARCPKKDTKEINALTLNYELSKRGFNLGGKLLIFPTSKKTPRDRKLRPLKRRQ